MLQQNEPDDYVISTGLTHSVKGLLQIAFDYVNLNWKDYVKDYVIVDPKFVRPAEVKLLLGDLSKARKKLGWKPRISFEELVRMMVDADLEKVKNNIHLSNIQAQKRYKIKE